MTPICIENITKRFGVDTAVDAVNVKIEAGELFFILGPSGCGKTTLLRMIAGFIDPDAGVIRFGDRDVTHLAANRRETGMVFQSYALWPHMTVLDNVAYGLKVRRSPAAERREKALTALDSVRMKHLAERKPPQLSGGEQQRVALARALVVQPKVLLLDEPLSNLDAALRQEMRLEIRRLCKASGITTVYVTHDQKEALAMADRMAVLRQGRVEQIGPPRELYANPASRFVAGFLGETNFLDGTVVEAKDDTLTIETSAGRLTGSAPAGAAPSSGTSVTCSIRPEALRLNGGDAQGLLRGRLVETVFLGETAQHHVELADGTPLKVLQIHAPDLRPDGDLSLSVDPADVIILTS